MGVIASRYLQAFSTSVQVHQHLISLSNLKLQKIRFLQRTLRDLTSSPFVKTPQFRRVLYQLDVRYPEEALSVFLHPTHPGCVNYLHFITALVLFSCSHWYYKVKCKHYLVIFCLFDFDQSGGISFDELVIMGVAVLSAACVMIGSPPPKTQDLTGCLTEVFEQLRGENTQISLER